MSNRSQAIADILTRAIIDHRLVPGCKLGERELSEIFGVSRIVIRQALIRLADHGLAQIERNRGAFVASPSVEEAKNVFLPFWRASASREHDSGGSGLGLAISKQLIDLHRGKIWVESSHDEVVFLIELPRISVSMFDD